MHINPLPFLKTRESKTKQKSFTKQAGKKKIPELNVVFHEKDSVGGKKVYSDYEVSDWVK